jgi:methyl-accepting chemotaxis protein
VAWFVAVMYVLVKKIVVPINKVATAAKAILEGNLSATVPTNPHSELSDVSKLLNELSTNFQEILLLTGTVVGDSLTALEKMQQNLDKAPDVSAEDLRSQIHSVRQHLEMLRATVEDFEYYQAKFNGRAAFGDSPQKEEATSVGRHDRLYPAVDCGSEPNQPHANRPEGKRDD